MLLYLIKLSISLSIVYLFYQLFLRRLTFYNWNRWYLLIYSMVCFIIPFINVFTIIVERPALRESAFIKYIPPITQMSPAANEAGATPVNSINWWQWTVIVIVSGMLLMVVRLLLQYHSLYKMRSKAVLLYDEKVKLYHIDEPVMPFSFGRGIYVNQHQHSEDELKDIIRHEFIHVKQRHSLDILWSELLCILNWYNPFAWLLRHDIRQNLEFVADQQVLQTGLDRKQYQYLLLKVIGVNSFSIATNFNFSSLKRRIAMMNKTQSARVHLIRFLFLLPLLVVVLLAFRNTSQERRQSHIAKEIKADTIPATKEYPALKEIVTIDITDEGKATIRLKNGKVEKYDFMVPKEMEAFERKYGKVPEPPQPPALPAKVERTLPDVPEAPEAPEKPEKPEAPERPEATEMPERPEIPEKPELADTVYPPNPPNILAHLDYGPRKLVIHPRRSGTPNAPEPPPAPEAPEKATIALQDCLNKKGYCITIADNFGECIVIVKDKNNKILEAIFLTDWNKDKKYEEKYGEIPPHQPKHTVRIVQGQPATLTNLEKVKTENAKTDVAIVERASQKPKVVLSYDRVAVPKPAASIQAKTNKVELLELKEVPRIAVSAKAAAEPTARVDVKPKVDEVIVMGIKSEAKAAMSAKPAVEAKPKVTLKLQKVEPKKEPKPAHAREQ
jgi:hypothetical protein